MKTEEARRLIEDYQAHCWASMKVSRDGAREFWNKRFQACDLILKEPRSMKTRQTLQELSIRFIWFATGGSIATRWVGEYFPRGIAQFSFLVMLLLAFIVGCVLEFLHRRAENARRILREPVGEDPASSKFVHTISKTEEQHEG